MSIEIAKNLADMIDEHFQKELWDTLDADGDGRVTSKEWGSKVYQNQEVMSRYFGGSTLSEIGHAFNRIDQDQRGSLSWEEFSSGAKSYAAAVKIAEAAKTDIGRAELKDLWETIDKDGDGKVSGKEWGSAVYKNQDILKKYFGGSSLKEIGQTFNRIDADNSDSLTWEEFVRDTQL